MINSLAALDLHVSLKADTLFTVLGFGVTNSMLTGGFSLLIFLAVFIYTSQMVTRGKYNRFVGLMQWGFEGMVGQIDSVIPNRKLARSITPLGITIFFFVIIAYWMSVMPGMDSIKYGDAPVIRAITADLNFTFAISIIALVTVQFYAITQHGSVGNLKRYLRNPFKDFIGSFEGLLELIGEVSRYSALSLRLFGNCFAGEILLVITAVLTGYFAVVTLPLFIGFELFIGFIQAYVFFMLTVIFTALAIEAHDPPKPDYTTPLPPDHSSAAQSNDVVQPE